MARHPRLADRARARHRPRPEPGEERADYGAMALERRLRDTLARLNADLPCDALDDAFRKLTRPEGSTLGARNRASSPRPRAGRRRCVERCWPVTGMPAVPGLRNERGIRKRRRPLSPLLCLSLSRRFAPSIQ